AGDGFHGAGGAHTPRRPRTQDGSCEALRGLRARCAVRRPGRYNVRGQPDAPVPKRSFRIAELGSATSSRRLPQDRAAYVSRCILYTATRSNPSPQRRLLFLHHVDRNLGRYIPMQPHRHLVLTELLDGLVELDLAAIDSIILPLERF